MEQEEEFILTTRASHRDQLWSFDKLQDVGVLLLGYSGLKCHEKIGLGVVRPRTTVYFSPKEMGLNV